MAANVRANGTGRQGIRREDAPAGARHTRADRDLESTVQLSPLAAFICAVEDGRVFCANAPAEAFIGVGPGRLAGRLITDFYKTPVERVPFLERLERDGTIMGRLLQASLPDGRTRWVESANRLVTYRGVPCVLTVFTDVTHIREAQTQAQAQTLETAALAEISLAIASGRPNELVFRSVARVVKRLVAYDRIGIAVIDPEDDLSTLIFVRGTRIRGREQGTSHATYASLNAGASERRATLVSNDDDPGRLLQDHSSLKGSMDAGLRSFVTVPLIADDRVVGTLCLSSRSRHAYDERAAALLERVASLVAPAIEQSRLYGNLEQEAEDRRVIGEIGRLFNSSPDVDSAFNRFAELVREIIPAERVVISALEDDDQKFVALHASGPITAGRAPGERVSTVGSVIEEVMRTRRPIVLHPGSRAALETAYPAALPLYDEGIRSYLSIPLFVGDRGVGVLHFRDPAKNLYGRRHVQLAELVGGEIAGVIANGRLRTAEQRTARENAALAVLSRNLSRPGIDSAAMEGATETIRTLVPFDRLGVSLVDTEGSTFTLIHCQGLAVDGRVAGSTNPLDGSVNGEMVARKVAFILSAGGPDDLRARYPTLRPLLDTGFRSFLNVPLIANRRVIASMSYASLHEDAYRNSHLQTAERIALQLAPVLEQARLYEALEREAREKRVIAEIGRVLAQPIGEKGVYERFTALASELIPNDRIAVVTLTEDGKHFKDSHASGAHPPDYDPSAVYAIKGTLTERAVRDRGPVLFNPASREEALAAIPSAVARYDEGVRSFLTAPLISAIGPVGALHFRSNTPGAFSRQHVLLAEGIASQIAGVVASFRVHEAERRKSAVNEALAGISAIMARRRAGKDLFEDVAAVVGRIVRFDRIGIALMDDDGKSFTLVFVRGTRIKGRGQGTKHLLGDSLNPQVADQRAGMVIDADDPSALRRFPSLHGNLHAGLRSFLTAPMVADDRVVGTISLRSKRRRAYSDGDLATVERIAALLAPALEQARLYDNLAREAKEREIIAEIGRVISASPEIDDVYDRFAGLARQVIPADRIAVTALEEDGASFVILHASGAGAPGRERGQRLPVEGSVMKDLVHAPGGVLFHPRDRDQVAREYATLVPLYDAGLRSFLSIPLYVGKQSAGALHFFSKSRGEYNRRHVLLAESVASQIAGVIAISQLRAVERRAADENAALAELSRTLSRPGGTEEILTTAIEVIATVLPIDRVGIGFTTARQDRYTLVYSYPEPLEGREGGTVHPVAGSVMETVIRDKEPVVIPDLGGPGGNHWFDRYPQLRLTGNYRHGSLMAAPLVSEDEVIGSITVSSATPGTYLPAQVPLLQRIAAHVAPFLEKARLYGELERESNERQMLAEIGRVVSQSPDISHVSERFSELTGGLIPYDRLSLVMLDGDSPSMTSVFTTGLRLPGRDSRTRLPLKGTMTGRVVTGGGPILLNAASPGAVREIAPNLLAEFKLGIRSFLSTPLVADGKVVGVLHLRSTHMDAYSERHVPLAEAIAGQIAGVMATSRLREAERRDAETNAALAAIGRIISSSLDMREVFDGFAEQVARVLPADRLVITTIDTTAQTATDTYVHGAEVPGWGEGTVHEIPGTPFEQVIRTRSIQRSDDVGTEMEDAGSARETIAKAGLRSSIMAPLFSDGEVIGSLNLKCFERGVYNDRHVELAARIADQIAGAIANARLYEDVQRIADERRALGAIALAATRDLDLDGVFARAADALVDIVEYDRLTVTLLDGDSDQLKVAFARGSDLPGFHVGALVKPVPGDPHDGNGWTWAGGLAVGRRTGDALPSLVTAPLGTRTRHLGYIRLRSRKPGVYTEHTVDLLQRAASYLTPALQNALEHQQAIHLAEERERSLLLDQENRELQRLNQAKSRFLSTVSHELKTPLTSITAFTGILLKNRRGGMTEKDLSQLEVIRRNSRRLGGLIDDLLDLSRLDRGAMDLSTSDFDACDLISEAIDDFRPISEAKSQPVVFARPARPIRLHADRNRLNQVLTNLLSNASKYSPDTAPVEVAMRRWRDRLYVSVTDSGFGISKADQKALFSLFFRADNENTRAVPGTGIGLYISRSIVELHGGRIEVKSGSGKGTTVTFWLPGASFDEGVVDRDDGRLAELMPWAPLDDPLERAAS